MARRLKDRLVAAAGPVEEKPTVKIPDPDKAQSLAVAAADGIAAVHELYDERNKSVELAQSLHRHNVYLLNVNNSLKAELQHARMERDHYMRLNARISSEVGQAHSLLGRVVSQIGHTSLEVERMEAIPVPTNNPDVPPIDANGLPIIEAYFDEQGMPKNGGAPSGEDLQKLVSQLAK